MTSGFEPERQNTEPVPQVNDNFFQDYFEYK